MLRAYLEDSKSARVAPDMYVLGGVVRDLGAGSPLRVRTLPRAAWVACKAGECNVQQCWHAGMDSGACLVKLM